jgi:hypothetical protein
MSYSGRRPQRSAGHPGRSNRRWQAIDPARAAASRRDACNRCGRGMGSRVRGRSAAGSRAAKEPRLPTPTRLPRSQPRGPRHRPFGTISLLAIDPALFHSRSSAVTIEIRADGAPAACAAPNRPGRAVCLVTCTKSVVWCTTILRAQNRCARPSMTASLEPGSLGGLRRGHPRMLVLKDVDARTAPRAPGRERMRSSSGDLR